MLLFRMHNTDTGTFLAGTSCTARTVGVVLYIIWQSKVNDMRQVIDIQATGSHISCHQQLRQVLTELLHGQVTLLLREVTM